MSKFKRLQAEIDADAYEKLMSILPKNRKRLLGVTIETMINQAIENGFDPYNQLKAKQQQS